MHNGILTATPNPCTLVNGQTSCSSTISWNPAQGTILERIDQTSGTDTFNFAATGTVVDNNIHGCGILYKLFKSSSVLADSILVKTQNPVSTSPALGTLTAPDTCTVPVGKSTCDRTKVGIGWTSTGATNLNLSWIPTTMSLQGVSNPWTVISEWVPGVTIYWFPIPYPSATFYLKNGATLLKSKTVTAVCQSGSVWNGSICAAITYSCTGTVPANATMFTNDNVNLLENTPYTYWSIDTGTRCQYSCNGGYNWNGSTCAVAAPLSCNANTTLSCVLPLTLSGSSAGTCSPSYNGSCDYTCMNGTWAKNSNSCFANCTLPVCGAASTICIGTTCTDCSGLTTGTKNCSGWKEVSPN